MKLSIVIVHYNTPEFLFKCLESLTGDGGLPGDWEVIIVDNGSNSKYDLPAGKAGIRNTKQIQNQNVQIIENEKNVGFSKANNIGIKKSKGELVLLLNPDTIVSQKAIGRVVDYMDEHANVSIATCRVELTDGKIDDASHRGFPTPWNAFCHFSGISKLFPKSTMFNGYHLGYQEMDTVHEIDACVGAFMMIRRSAGEKVGWLDEDYFWYGEDIDICYKIKQAGSKVVYIPDAKITHYKGVSSGIKEQSKELSTATAETQKRAQKERFRAMRLFYKKHYQSKYPHAVTYLVEKGIGLLEYFNSR